VALNLHNGNIGELLSGYRRHYSVFLYPTHGGFIMAMGKRVPESCYYEIAIERGFTYTGGYVGSSKAKVGWDCGHGHHWESRYNDIHQGHGCPYCAKCAVIEELAYHELAVERGFAYMGGYVGNSHTNANWACSKGHNWQADYSSIRKGHGCPYCAGNAVIPESAYYELAVERGFTYINGYTGSTLAKVRWMCGSGHRWQSRYTDIQHGRGCPRCVSSKGEKMIDHALTRWGIRYEAERRFRACQDKKPLPFDFFIPKWKILIEYQGQQHYEIIPSGFFGGQKELAELQRRDTIKRAFAEKYDYTLIEIPYTIENVSGYLLAELMKATGLSYAEISESKQDGDRVSVRMLADDFGNGFFDYVQLPIF